MKSKDTQKKLRLVNAQTLEQWKRKISILLISTLHLKICNHHTVSNSIPKQKMYPDIGAKKIHATALPKRETRKTSPHHQT
jgi:hypothetical protein